MRDSHPYTPETTNTPDGGIARLAVRQHGVVTRGQLRELGLSDRSVENRLAVGRLHALHRGVYAVGHRRLSREGRALAATLACAPGAALSHRSAAALWGLPVREGLIEVSVARRLHQRPGIRVHPVRSLEPRDVTQLGGVPITTPARTLLDLAEGLDPRALGRAVRQAEVLRIVTTISLEAQLSTSAGRHNADRLAAIVAHGPAPTRSELEDLTLDLLRRHGLPQPETNVLLTECGFEVDLLFRGPRVIVECDGDRYHGTRLAREHDARRQARLEAAGYRVLRLTWQQVVSDELRTVERVRLALAAVRPRGTS